MAAIHVVYDPDDKITIPSSETMKNMHISVAVLRLDGIELNEPQIRFIAMDLISVLLQQINKEAQDGSDS